MRKEPRAPARAKLNVRQQHTLNARRMVPFVAKPALLLNLIWSRRKRKEKKKGWEKNYTQGNKYKVVSLPKREERLCSGQPLTGNAAIIKSIFQQCQFMRIKYDLQSVAIIAVNYKHAVDKKVSVVSSSDFDGNHFLPSPATLSVFRYKTRPPLHLLSRISPVKQGTSFWQATRLTLAQILHTRNPILLYMENGIVSFTLAPP